MTKSWIQTYSGVAFDLVHPTVEMVTMVDMVHVMPQLWRYNCHTNRPYSVGEHLILVAHLARAIAFEERGDVDGAFWGGMTHDLHETWYQDLTSPLKSLLSLEEAGRLREALRRCDEAVYSFFGWKGPSDDARVLVKRADYAILEWERQSFMGPCDRSWVCEDDPAVDHVLEIGRKHRVFPRSTAVQWDVKSYLIRYLDDLQQKRKIQLLSFR